MRNAPHQVGVLRNEVVYNEFGDPIGGGWNRVATTPAWWAVVNAEEATYYNYDVSASVRIPNDVTVERTDRIEVDLPDHPGVPGLYEVEGIRWNPDHQRLLVRAVNV